MEVVQVVHGRDPRAVRRAYHRAGGGPRVGGSCGPTWSTGPHSFRKTLAQLGERVRRTPEEFKAWSQNLGHEHVMTTFTSYGAVATSRQAEIIRRLNRPNGSDIPMETLAEQLREIAARIPSSS